MVGTDKQCNENIQVLMKDAGVEVESSFNEDDYETRYSHLQAYILRNLKEG